jgi:hypothetical protein
LAVDSTRWLALSQQAPGCRRASTGRPGAAERAQRLAHAELPTGVQIRDQRPMPSAALEACLVGLTLAEWYALINARVFFWFDPDRLNRQRAACEPRPLQAFDGSGNRWRVDEVVAPHKLNFWKKVLARTIYNPRFPGHPPSRQFRALRHWRAPVPMPVPGLPARGPPPSMDRSVHSHASRRHGRGRHLACWLQRDAAPPLGRSVPEWFGPGNSQQDLPR